MAQEQDALDYFTGENFYSYYQSLETPSNIYDTRSISFVKSRRKMGNARKFFESL